MNILMLTNTYLPHVGGVARSVEGFAAEFRRRGHRVLIVAPEFQNRPATETDVIRVPAIQNFNSSDFSVRLAVPGLLSTALEEFRPDIVHSHHPFLLGDTAIRVAASHNVPLVFTHHTMYEQYTHYVPGEAALLGQFVIDLTVGYTNLCDAVIAPSQSVAETLRERGVVTPIEVIPTGIDIESFRSGDGEALRNELRIPSNAFVVGHVGRLAPEKNLPFLANAVARFLRRNMNAHFLIVGAGPSEEDVRRVFRSARFRGRVHLAGARQGQQLANAYDAMDVFAFASCSETQGLVLTEAMAAGRPVVAIDAPGVREVVADRSNGRLLPTQDETDFAAALDWVAGQSATAKRALQDGARQTALEFSMQRTAEKALGFYQSLTTVEGRSPSGAGTPWEAAMRLVQVEWEMWSNLAHAATSAVSSPQFLRVPVLGRALNGWKLIRRWFNAPKWSARVLELPVKSEYSGDGLLLVKIEGLSRAHLEQSLRKGRMPFIRRLLTHEGYRLHTHYSGLPSISGAAEAGLFYGVKSAVPGGRFRWQGTGELVRATDPRVTKYLERQLARGRVALLEGGSVTGTMFVGGARDSRFCTATGERINLLDSNGGARGAAFLVLQAGVLMNACRYLFWEAVDAMIEFVRDVGRPGKRKHSAAFRSSRFKNCLRRDLMSVTGAMDASRNLDVIHLNYAAFDAQSHHGGPDSPCAQRALRGIDRALEKLWIDVRRSASRPYRMWIYSDHGHVRATAYEAIAGRPIESAVGSVFRQSADIEAAVDRARGQARLGQLLLGRIQPLHSPRHDSKHISKHIQVAVEGSIGHIYIPYQMPAEDLRQACRRLVDEERVPLVLSTLGTSKVYAWNRTGEFELPRDAAEVLGSEHPFLRDTADDLVFLCHHPQAGEVVICGFQPGQEVGQEPGQASVITFSHELGAHGGPGPLETGGFALLPVAAAASRAERPYLNSADLRRAALRAMGRARRDRRQKVPPERDTLAKTAREPIERHPKHDDWSRLNRTG